jgi:hypothetical protein
MFKFFLAIFRNITHRLDKKKLLNNDVLRKFDFIDMLCTFNSVTIVTREKNVIKITI